MGVCVNNDVMLTAGTAVALIVAPAEYDYQGSYRVVNQSAKPIKVTVFRAATNNPADWRGILQWDRTVHPDAPLDDGPIGVAAGQTLWVKEKTGGGDANATFTGQKLSAA